ncbi:MAG: hypothetical protein MZV64_24335 [Ignavibacteriales bacterium]|nr:hypothetical protein [Ignavibacteriales bacterium]
MTSYGSERNAVDVIKSGALDYIVESSGSMSRHAAYRRARHRTMEGQNRRGADTGPAQRERGAIPPAG